jgi:hypothetical protein
VEEKTIQEAHKNLEKKLTTDLGKDLNDIPLKGASLNRIVLEKVNLEGDPSPDNYRVTVNDLVMPFVKAVSVEVDIDQPLSIVTLKLFANVEIK